MRSKKNRYLHFLSVLVILFTIPISIEARELEGADVRQAVEIWVRQVTADARPEVFIVDMEPYQMDGQTLAYIAHLSGGGFCLCGSDDMVLPVYYYCPRGSYDPDNSNYKYILWEIGTRLNSLRQMAEKGDSHFYSYQSELLDRSTFWGDLISGRAPSTLKPSISSGKADPDSMRIDFTPHWHQDSPYNDQCPELTPAADDHVKVGAAATAMAQIMYYWQWPHSGEGSGSVNYEYRWLADWTEWPLSFDPGISTDPIWVNRLEWTAGGGGKLRMRGYWDQSLFDAAKNLNGNSDYSHALDEMWKQFATVTNSYSIDYGAQTYDWSLTEDVHTDVLDPGAAEAAKVCYHAGVAAQNAYGIIESNAALPYVKNAFKDHFRYDSDVKEEGKNIDNLTTEIQYFRPVAFKGDDAINGTHAWIFYGYNIATDPNRQFLTNMGFGGDDDGWYTCDSIGYVGGQREVIRIAPENVVRFVGGTSSGDGSPDNPFRDLSEALAAVPDSITLIFKAGTTVPCTGDPLILDRPMVLKGKMVLGE